MRQPLLAALLIPCLIIACMRSDGADPYAREGSQSPPGTSSEAQPPRDPPGGGSPTVDLFLNIIPPGQDGVFNALEVLTLNAGATLPFVRDQAVMYDRLVRAAPQVRDEQLLAFYKEAPIALPPEPSGILRQYSPTPGATVTRDSRFGVPHIEATTREAALFAAGYTGAEDRLFLMDVLRHLGRARVSEFLGASPANVAMDRDQLAVAPYTEEDLTRQLARLAERGPEGAQVVADVEAYADGVNRYISEALVDPGKLPAEYPALQQVPRPWKPEDVVAIASLVGGIFGKGGGRELHNLCGLEAMAARLGSRERARQVLASFSFLDGPEAPVHTTRRFPYMTDLGPVDPASQPPLDCASLEPVDPGASGEDAAAIFSGTRRELAMAPWGPIPLSFATGMSNAVLVSAERTRAGYPIAVFGPQTGYFMPQLLVEKSIRAPGIEARGVAFAGTDIYVQLGRGRDYAWSATSASVDIVDHFVLRLCEPAGGPATLRSMGYLHGGVCHPIEAFTHTEVAKPSGAGLPPVGEAPTVVLSFRVERTAHYGPLVARGRLVDGTPVAVALLRSTYGDELGSAIGFLRVNDPLLMAGGYASFREAMSRIDYTFNWFYVDAADIGYQVSARAPRRARGVDPRLPTWGGGKWDWQGFAPRDALPNVANPPSGYIVSWNNKQAPGFGAADDNFSYGPVHRSQLLERRIRAALARGPVGAADVVNVMGDAATVDARGQEVLPVLLEALGPTAPEGVDARAQEMRDRLAAWAAAAAHRRDRDGDGQYDDAVAPAILDAWWEPLTRAIFSDAATGGVLDAVGIPLHDAPQKHVGSAFIEGTYGHVQKDLRQALGRRVEGRLGRTWCGDGNLATCRARLWASLGEAAQRLTRELGTAEPSGWRRTVADDAIRHSAVGLVSVPDSPWQNRPTFQQVVQIMGR